MDTFFLESIYPEQLKLFPSLKLICTYLHHILHHKRFKTVIFDNSSSGHLAQGSLRTWELPDSGWSKWSKWSKYTKYTRLCVCSTGWTGPRFHNALDSGPGVPTSGIASASCTSWSAREKTVQAVHFPFQVFGLYMSLSLVYHARVCIRSDSSTSNNICTSDCAMSPVSRTVKTQTHLWDLEHLKLAGILFDLLQGNA